MYCGIDLPTTGEFADVRTLAHLARDAEAAGWDGFFLYDQIAADPAEPLIDPWIALTAIALATVRLRFGPLVTPLPRRRPWKVARETVTLDHLSGGRLILGVGLGIAPEEFDDLDEAPDLATRARMLDEALDVVTGLWSGEPFAYSGRYFRVRRAQFLPVPVQRPRIPIWVGGTWPARAPFLRAAHWDGVVPHYRDADGRIAMMPPASLGEALAFMRAARGSAPFESALRGSTPGDDRARATAIVTPYARAGLTWWLEGVDGGRTLAEVRARILQGPPVDRALGVEAAARE